MICQLIYSAHICICLLTYSTSCHHGTLYFLQQIFSGSFSPKNKQGLPGYVLVPSASMCRFLHDSCWLYGDLYPRALYRPAMWQNGSGSQQMKYGSCWVFAAKGMLSSIETWGLILFILLHLILKWSVWFGVQGLLHWDPPDLASGPALRQNMVKNKLTWVTVCAPVLNMESNSFLYAPSLPSDCETLWACRT